MIRNPVRINSRYGDTLWWGIFADLDMIVQSERSLIDPTISSKARVGVSVDSFYNRVKVAYTELNAGDDSIGDRADTAWADNDESQDEYGIKELLWTKDNATATFAAAARDRKLSQIKYPIPTLQTYKGRRESEAKITCIGLWDTLGWYYYANAGTTEVDTALQIKTMVEATSERIAGVDQRVTSGIDSVEYRDGDASLLYEVQQLLEMGTDNDLRMLAQVTEGTRLEVYEEPTEDLFPHSIADDDTWYGKYGHLLRKETCPVGVYARMRNIVPATVSSALIADASVGFIDENEYDVRNDTLSYKTREMMDPWDFYIVRDG